METSRLRLKGRRLSKAQIYSIVIRIDSAMDALVNELASRLSIFIDQ